MGVFNELGKFLQIETRRLNHVAVIDGMTYQAREAVSQQIQMPCGSLDVGEGSWLASLEKIEPFSAHEDEAEVSEQLFIMLLADAVEVHDLTVEIIQNFNLGRLFMEKHLSAARECLYVCRVLREYFNQPLRQSVLPTYIRQRSSHLEDFNEGLPGKITSAKAHWPKRELSLQDSYRKERCVLLHAKPYSFSTVV